ncbi:serine hydrolase [Phytomonospora sp. NPDC050363]|uniref:serine hydrolase n=1 Tax=Phytomonospora sp. NPDC050363 TaxID=3155642 RepID=UPI0033DBB687
MSALDDIAAWLTDRLPELVAERKVAGASVAVLAGGEVVDAAAGSANLRAGIPATADTLFQIGSITKIWTTTLVMRLVDEGLVELDAPVVKYLPEFRTADPEVSARITVRHLLNHTAGFEGDVFRDTGRGDDAVAKLVEEVLPTVPQPLQPGRLFSYNNAAFCVLGRIVEVLRGTTWGAAVHDELAGPLGVTVATNADEAILHRAAVGHLATGPGGEFEVQSTWGLPASNGPAGAMLSTSARDLLAFARLHLDGGVTPGGTRLLSAESVERMRVAEVDVPRRSVRPMGIGLGWHLFDWEGGREVVGHDGNTVGQTAFLRLLPGEGVAVAMLTNGGDVGGLAREVFGHVLGELAGVSVPGPLPVPENPSPVTNPERYAGSYDQGLVRFDVVEEDGRLWLDSVNGTDLAGLLPPTPRKELLRLDGDLFVAVSGEPGDAGAPVVFLENTADGKAAFLHNHWANPRIEG